MRAALEWLVSALPFDAWSRRAIDETFADWAKEADDARGTAAHAAVAARAWASVAHVITQATVAEMARVPYGWVAARGVLFVIGPSLVLAAIGWGHMLMAPAADVRSAIDARALLLPQTFVAALPVALFLLVAWSGARRVPAMGLASVAIAAALGISTWLVPYGTRQFHVVEYAQRTGRSIESAAARLPYGPGDLPVADLVARAVGAPISTYGGTVMFRTGMVALVPAFVALGAVVRLRSRARRGAWTVTVLVLYGLALAATPRVWELGAHTSIPAGVCVWLFAAAVASLAFSLGSEVPSLAEVDR